MTIDQLSPDIDGPYRHRATGEIRRLHAIDGGWVFLMTPEDTCRPVKLSTFWEKWIHANAGESG